MDEYVKIVPGLLFFLAKQPSELRRFLTRVHTMVERGDTWARIKRAVLVEEGRRGISVVQGAVKSVLPFFSL